MKPLFFERQKTARGEWPTIYSRDIFPVSVRFQCWKIICDYSTHINFEPVIDKIEIAIGKQIPKHVDRDGYINHHISLSRFFMLENYNISNVSDVDIAFSILELLITNSSSYEVIELLNKRLQQAGIGYKIIDNELVPIDDDLLTETAIIPLISLLNRSEFETAYQYLHQAYSDYKLNTDKSLESAIDNAAKSIEALLKYIFDKRGIPYEKTDSHSKLIQIATQNNLFPDIPKDHLSPLSNALKALPDIRNKGAGHGKTTSSTTPKLVRLALHHTTANMLFIAESYLEQQ